jgi:hypothetical protein
MLKTILPIAISALALFFVLFIIFDKRQKPWSEMNEQEKKRKKIMLFSGLAVFIAGIAAFFMSKKKDKTH